MKVLVTRRAEDCKRTAQRIRSVGHEPVLLPLLRRIRLENRPRTQSPDFLIFTSVSGVACTDHDAIAHTKTIPVYAVGARTADALGRHAYKNIRSGDGDAMSLAQQIATDMSGSNATGIHFSGVDRAFDFNGKLKENGIAIEVCEAYRMNVIYPKKAEFSAVLEDVRGGAVLLYSPRSAKHFSALVDLHGCRTACRELRVIAISGNTASVLDKAVFRQILIANSPDETAMLSRLA